MLVFQFKLITSLRRNLYQAGMSQAQTECLSAFPLRYNAHDIQPERCV